MSDIVKPRLQMTMRGGQLVPVSALYEGASSSPRLAGKGNVLSGPNMPLARSLPLLQSRSRNAVRNNAYAAGARDTYASNLVGSGIRPDWKNEAIQTLWDRWIGECDADGVNSLYGLQSLCASGQFEAGEVFTRFRFRRPTDGLSVPLQLQLIESEQLDAGYSRAMDGRLIKMGIEFDAIGRRSAYHLWRYHPHEKLTAQMNVRVPIPADQIVHVYRQTRPGQLRGVPELSSVILRLYEIDEMQDALLAKQKLSQLFGVFVKRKPGEFNEDSPENFHGELVTDGQGEEFSEFVPGGIHYLDTGEEVQFSSPGDIGSAYTDWLRSELLAVARGAGLTYEQLTGDLKNVNYSSIRAGLLEFRRRVEALQAYLMVHQWCRPIAAKWLDTAIVSGAIALEDYWELRSAYLAIDWIATKWEWVDPLKEEMADLIAVRSGFKPRSEAAAERGWDIISLDRAIAEGNQSADDNSLVLDSDPRAVNKSGTLQKDALELIKETEED
ncbi:MAG: phage portal protein [Pseudomonadota bacterium]